MTATERKKLGYLVFLMTPALPVASWWLGRITGSPDFFAWLTPIYIYGAIPVLDYLIGQDHSNPGDAETEALRSDRWYKALLALCVPIMVVLLAWAAFVFANAGFSWPGKLGWVLSIGMVSATLAINVAHELIHKRSRTERMAGGFLMSLVCYGGFKVEHVRGHHVNVSTPEDSSSARLGQSLYQFLPRAFYHNVVNAWRLEARRLEYLGLPAWHWRNELVWWYLLSLAVAILAGLVLGTAGVVFFLSQSLVAATFLEIVNYLEHYGLRRKRLPNGRYERTTHLHSWNSNYLLTNLLLFQLQRHSDHHENPTREYQLLRHYEDSPQLPAGYATMMLLALVPPLWHKVMDPRVRSFYGQVPV